MVERCDARVGRAPIEFDSCLFTFSLTESWRFGLRATAVKVSWKLFCEIFLGTIIFFRKFTSYLNLVNTIISYWVILKAYLNLVFLRYFLLLGLSFVNSINKIITYIVSDLPVYVCMASQKTRLVRNSVETGAIEKKVLFLSRHSIDWLIEMGT